MSISFEISRRGFISALLTAPLAGCTAGESATVRFRVIATVLVDGKFVESSSVMEVRYWRVKNSLIGSGGASRLYGEALILDLKDKGTVYVLPMQHLDTGPLVSIYEFALLSTFGVKNSIGTLSDSDFKNINERWGRLPINYSGSLPAFVAFSDEANPKSIFEIDPRKIGEVFPGVEFVSLEIERTNAALTSVLRKRLSWLSHASRKTVFERDPPGHRRPKKDKPLGFIITEDSFFGDGSV